MFTEGPEHLLRDTRSAVAMPVDFAEFWADSLTEARTQGWFPELADIPGLLQTVNVQDVTFPGFAGDPIRAWLRTPADASGPLPTVVEFVGYGGGRGHPDEALYWASAGFAHLHVDTRGQGSMWSPGDTVDPQGSGPSAPGFTTRGIESRETAYYRRLVVDAVRAIDAAAQLPLVDRDRIATLGFSQGGYLSLAAASLHGGVRRAFSFVPFLCDIARAVTLTDREPYREIGRYFATHRERTDAALRTLTYLDGVNFARIARTPITFSAALMDATCPPSTVFAAFNEYAGPKEISVWEYNAHEGGGIEDLRGARRTLTSDVE
jgi:cephalosporin-C deacetylase